MSGVFPRAETGVKKKRKVKVDPPELDDEWWLIVEPIDDAIAWHPCPGFGSLPPDPTRRAATIILLRDPDPDAPLPPF